MAQAEVHSPPISVPGSYFNTGHDNFHKGHATCNSIYRPPAPSPRPSAVHSTSYNRSRNNRSLSSIPRPVSRSKNDDGNVRKRPRLEDRAYSPSRTSIPSAVSTPNHELHRREQPYQFCGLDGESEYDLSYFSVAHSTQSRDALSPPPFINTSYKLAGGLDTPGASFERKNEEWGNQQEELDWRVNRYTKARRITEDTSTTLDLQSFPQTPLSVSGNGQKRPLDESPPFETPAESISINKTAYSASGWHIRSRAWAVTGGLAFKAINFCWNTAFRGFSAGGGQSYAMDLGTPEVPTHGFRVSQLAATEDVFSSQYEKQDEVPGRFPEDDLGEDYVNRNHPDTLTPTLQRRQTDDSTSELKSDWFMVDRPNVTRRRSRASVAGSRSGSLRQVSTTKVGGNLTSGASFASPRSRPNLNNSRRTSNTSVRLSPERRSRPSLSIIQPYQKDFPKSQNQDSPVHRRSTSAQSPSAMSPEVIKFEKRMRKKARQNDESMSRMNAHLQDLIRQGKEALGSKISIEDEHDGDQGFYEDGGSAERYHQKMGNSAW